MVWMFVLFLSFTECARPFGLRTPNSVVQIGSSSHNAMGGYFMLRGCWVVSQAPRQRSLCLLVAKNVEYIVLIWCVYFKELATVGWHTKQQRSVPQKMTDSVDVCTFLFPYLVL